ncbi:MAG: hypothetical protein EBT61_22805, partial [Verrucomicrobia bacterium]|nr:hypothetical protein [Verrucomicrobiota bacterium]
GAAKKEAGRFYALLQITVPAPDQAVTATTFQFRWHRARLRVVRRREGRYLLRSNLTGRKPAELWTCYMQLVQVEEAFKNLKGDLGLRPVFHQKMARIEAHILVAFIAYTLHVCLRQRLRAVAGGLTPRAVLEQMRASDPPVSYLVGTPKGALSALEKALLDRPWEAVRTGVQVKLLPQDEEVYVLAQSAGRVDKERAIRRKKLRRLLARLHELRRQLPERDQLRAVGPVIAAVAMPARVRRIGRCVSLKVRARQVVEQHLVGRAEEVAPLVAQVVEELVLERQDVIQRGVELVDLRQAEVAAQQVGQRGARKPVAMQVPLGAGGQQALGDQDLKDLIPARTFARGGQVGG